MSQSSAPPEDAHQLKSTLWGVDLSGKTVLVRPVGSPCCGEVIDLPYRRYDEVYRCWPVLVLDSHARRWRGFLTDYGYDRMPGQSPGITFMELAADHLPRYCAEFGIDPRGELLDSFQLAGNRGAELSKPKPPAAELADRSLGVASHAESPSVQESAESQKSAAPSNDATEPPKASAESNGDVLGAKPVNPKGRPKEPSTVDYQVYRFVKLLSKKQDDAARKFGVDQGTISRTLRRVSAWIKAGNVMPDLLQPKHKTVTMDPAKLEQGRRLDGRIKH